MQDGHLSLCNIATLAVQFSTFHSSIPDSSCNYIISVGMQQGNLSSIGSYVGLNGVCI